MKQKGKNGQNIGSVMGKPWKNEELRSAEEALPREKRVSLGKKGRDCIKQKQE